MHIETMANLTPELIHIALFGINDEEARQRFLDHFGDRVIQFEITMATVYESWLNFDKTFTKDRDSTTVVGTLFAVMARLVLSMKLLMTGHITLAGAAQRQALEAIALAFLFSKHGLPYLREAWDGRFSVNKAIDKLYKHRDKLNLEKEALEIMKKNRDHDHKLSHATILATNDIMNFGGAGIYLGASFDEAKLPFYEKEVISNVGLADILINVIPGVTRQMREWPCFADAPGD